MDNPPKVWTIDKNSNGVSGTELKQNIVQI